MKYRPLVQDFNGFIHLKLKSQYTVKCGSSLVRNIHTRLLEKQSEINVYYQLHV